MNTKKLLNFFFELGQLKRIRHEGWRLAGVESPDTIAAHSLRAAQIAYVLARLENCDEADRVVSMLVFHDMAEARIGDIHKVANRYLTFDEASVVEEQVNPLEEIGSEIHSRWLEAETGDSDAGQIAKDADLLEQALTAREYIEQGHLACEDWLNNIRPRLKTKMAKELLAALTESSSTDWWSELKQF